MTFIVAILAAFGTFVVSAFALSIAMGLMAEASQFFRLMFRVDPYKTLFALLLLFVSGWASVSVFDVLA